METTVKSMYPYAVFNPEMILRRAGFHAFTIPTERIIGEVFDLKVEVEGQSEEVHGRITGLRFNSEFGLWLEVDVPYLLGRPLRGVQYVVCSSEGLPSENEGWYVGLGPSPRGRFVKVSLKLLNQE